MTHAEAFMEHQTHQHAANLALEVDGADDLIGVQRCAPEATEVGGIVLACQHAEALNSWSMALCLRAHQSRVKMKQQM